MYVSLSLSRFHTCCHLISPWWRVLEDTRAHIHKKQLSKCVKIGSFKTGVCVFVGGPSCSCSLFSTQLLSLSWCLRNSNQQIIRQLFAKKIINKESLNHLESVQFSFFLSCRSLFLIFSEMFKNKKWLDFLIFWFQVRCFQIGDKDMWTFDVWSRFGKPALFQDDRPLIFMNRHVENIVDKQHLNFEHRAFIAAPDWQDSRFWPWTRNQAHFL